MRKIPTNRIPPKRQKGQGLGSRVIDGFVLNIPGAANFLGMTEKTLRGRIARRCLPVRHDLGGKVFFLREELEAHFRGCPGISVQESIENHLKEK